MRLSEVFCPTHDQGRYEKGRLRKERKRPFYVVAVRIKGLLEKF